LSSIDSFDDSVSVSIIALC